MAEKEKKPQRDEIQTKPTVVSVLERASRDLPSYPSRPSFSTSASRSFLTDSPLSSNVFSCLLPSCPQPDDPRNAFSHAGVWHDETQRTKTRVAGLLPFLKIATINATVMPLQIQGDRSSFALASACRRSSPRSRVEPRRNRWIDGGGESYRADEGRKYRTTDRQGRGWAGPPSRALSSEEQQDRRSSTYSDVVCVRKNSEIGKGDERSASQTKHP